LRLDCSYDEVGGGANNIPARAASIETEATYSLLEAGFVEEMHSNPVSMQRASAEADEKKPLYDANGQRSSIQVGPADHSESHDDRLVADLDAGDHLDHHTGHHRSVAEEEADGVLTYRRAIFTTLPLFMGYAGMIVLQHHIKNRLNIADSDHYMSNVFSAGVAFLYWGNLIMRLLHNVFFTCLAPRYRVVVAYVLMSCAHSVLFFAYYIAKSDHVVWTFFAYLLAGISIGSFESNLMSCLTPLGHGTKSWAVIGIPIGFNLVSVGFFILFAIWPNAFWIEGGSYVVIAIANLCGLAFFWSAVPYIPFKASADNAVKFLKDMMVARQWVPTIWRHCVSLMIDMFCVSLFSSIVLYIYDTDDIPLWPRSDTTVPKNAFQAVYNLCSFLGDFLSRRIAYRDKSRNPLIFVILAIAGSAMVLSKTALCAPIGIFCIMFCNGSIYAQSTRFIDNAVDDGYNLVALSMWLFIGDIGSVIGSNLVSVIQGPIGVVALAPSPPSATPGPNATHLEHIAASFVSGVAPW
jgi:hypothetical protein